MHTQAKALLMAVYFGADHLVWAYQIEILNDKKTGERVQKVRKKETGFRAKESNNT